MISLVIFLPLKVAVIVAVPFPMAVTKPFSETVATLVLFDFHVVLLSAPHKVRAEVLPGVNVTYFLLICTIVTFVLNVLFST